MGLVDYLDLETSLNFLSSLEGMAAPRGSGSADEDLANAFRAQYYSLLSSASSTLANCEDSNVVARLGDQLDEYLRALNEV